jgi:hypothetical protein
LKDRGVDGRTGSEWILGTLTEGAWSGFNYLRIWAGGGLLWIRRWTFWLWCHEVSYEETEKTDNVNC